MKPALVFCFLMMLGGCGSENGATAGKDFCDCVHAQKPVSRNPSVNHYTAEKICEGRMIEKYPLYRVYAVDMRYADTTTAVDWAERERARLFILDFAHYVNANCRDFN